MESKKHKRENTVHNVKLLLLCCTKKITPPSFNNRQQRHECWRKGKRIRTKTATLLVKQLEILKQKGGPSLTQYLYDCKSKAVSWWFGPSHSIAGQNFEDLCILGQLAQTLAWFILGGLIRSIFQEGLNGFGSLIVRIWLDGWFS